MIIMIKERHAHEKKYYYKTCCPNCGSKFVFDSDDIGDGIDNDYIACPVCSDIIHQCELLASTDGSPVEQINFKKISRWKYNWFMKRYGTKDTDEGDDIK